jgi:2-hydroxy-3-oxopropionate reductase
VPLPATALMTSQYIEARAYDEGGNGNQALFRVYDRMTKQVRTGTAKSGGAPV